MASNFVFVKAFAQRLEAEMAQSYLASQGITSIISANDASGMQPFLLAGMGGARLLVAEEHADEASELLHEMVIPVDEMPNDIKEGNGENHIKDMKIAKACWECGSEDIYWTTTDLNGDSARLLPKVSSVFLGHPELELYVCANCGYYRVFVPEKHLDQITQKWTKYEPITPDGR